MDEKIMNGIKAGVAGGIVLGLLAVIVSFVPLIGCLTWPINIIVWIGVGVAAIYLGPKAITKLMDAGIAGAVAGAVAGVILLIANILVLLLQMLMGGSIESLVVGLGITFVTSIISIIIAAVFGAIVAILYTYVVLKITK